MIEWVFYVGRYNLSMYYTPNIFGGKHNATTFAIKQLQSLEFHYIYVKYFYINIASLF